MSLAKGIVPQVEHMGRSYASSDTAHYSLVRPFDIVYTRSPLAIFKLGIVKQHKRDHNALVSPLYGVFAPHNRHLGQIVEAFFESPTRSYRYLDPLAQKGAKNTIQLSNERFLTGSLYLPDDENEQQKIADCLGSLDDLIAAEGRKLDALRRHKQGLVQQLFPQPGETVPRLRFPEFRSTEDWKETTIGNMGEVITGSTPSTSRRDFYGGGLMFVSPGDISDLRFVENTKTTLTTAGLAACRSIKENSILFVCIGSTIGKVAQCSRPCATNQQINSLVVNDAFYADFAYYLLDRESVRIAKLAGKQAVPIINKSSLQR
ncbi:MAG: restriction endonuclease subunit S [Candidatus Eisenbacteria bacterium]|nr:restriction endonuclease subunit S [Candidatus Eisenbacteria bacterium]